MTAYRWADVVAVPMNRTSTQGSRSHWKESPWASPFYRSRTGGVPTYFGEDEVFYTPVGDHRAMRDIVLGSDDHSAPNERNVRSSAFSSAITLLKGSSHAMWN